MSTHHINFSLAEENQAREFFETNGYVVFRDILSADKCKKTYDEIGEQMKKISPLFDIYDYNTYTDAPVSGNYVIYTNEPIFSKQFLLNRQIQNVYNAFRIIYNNNEIIVSHDRWYLYRPTKDKLGRKTQFKYPNLHLDFHPLGYDNPKLIIEKRNSIKYDNARDFIAENNLYCYDDGIQIQAI